MYTIGYIKSLDFLATGTVKSFQVKDPTGKLVCEYDDEFWG